MPWLSWLTNDFSSKLWIVYGKKNMPKGNPNPVITPEFKAQQFKPQGEVNGQLSSKAIGIKLPVEIDEVVRSLPNKAEWLRRIIAEAAQRELMGDES
jgi:hypothetical protein